MADILVRSIPDADAARIAAHAKRAGVSQSEYLRRLIHEAVTRHEAVPLSELAGAATGLFPDGILEALDREWAK